MSAQQIHIGVRGRIGDATARALGGWIAVTDDGFELVADYVDLAQLVGLLVRLSDLHVPFHRVLVSPIADDPPAQAVDPHDGTTDNPHDRSTS